MLSDMKPQVLNTSSSSSLVRRITSNSIYPHEFLGPDLWHCSWLKYLGHTKTVVKFRPRFVFICGGRNRRHKSRKEKFRQKSRFRTACPTRRSMRAISSNNIKLRRSIRRCSNINNPFLNAIGSVAPSSQVDLLGKDAFLHKPFVLWHCARTLHCFVFY